VDTLLSNADQAMYAAKASGRGCFHYFTPVLQAAAQRRLSLSNDLHHALNSNQFRIYYQPIVELNPQRIVKAEALIRWQHPQHGLISPSEFIPLAEETGMIIQIGDWVFKEAARQVQRLRQLYHPNFQISINKSPLQFRNDNALFQSWLPHLNQLGLSGDSIVIEITEGVLLDVEENVTKKLFAFRDAGIQVALDDFGTGYCALAYLNRFDIDYLKIDKSFVDKIAIKSNDLILCEAIIMMAHKLGLKVIAEGVETDEQCLLLTDIGCDYGQGYLFSKPVAIDEFELLLQRSIL
jgi:EAL domain-containing protein (putative c-di-GMP-specific phosphodiesterase class I)